MVRTADTDFYKETMGNIDLSPALVLSPETPLNDVIAQMRKKRCGCVVVQDGREVKGTFTERTLIQKVLAESVDLAAPVGAYANPGAPLLALHDRVDKAIRLMHENNVRHLPVFDGEAIRGVLSVRDVIGLVAQYNPEEIYNLPPRVRQEMKSVEGA